MSWKRPFNNKKRTRGRKQQVQAEKAWHYLKNRLKEIQDEGQELHNDEETR